MIGKLFVRTMDWISRILLPERPVAWVIRLYLRFFQPRILRAYGRASIALVRNVPQSVLVHGPITIIAPDRLQIGDHVRIGRDCFLHCLGGVSIGQNTQISRQVLIYSASHDYKGEALPFDIRYDCRSVVIGENVWIGMRVVIRPGVTIGDGAIIGMGAVVAKDVAPGEIVVCAPQRVVGMRDMNRYRALASAGRLFGKIWPNH